MSEKNIIFGVHAVEALLARRPEGILRAYFLESALKQERQAHKLQAILKIISEYHIPHELVTREILDRLTKQGNHQGIVLHCAQTKIYSESELKPFLETIQGPPLLLILDSVQDPHNLGACLRTAEAAGVHAVIVPKDKAVGLTSTVIKVACGAAEILPFFQITNLARVMEGLKEEGIWLFGLAEEAEKNLYEADLKLPLALVLGNEEKGLRHLTRERCDLLLNIPMQGLVSSLNVSVAAGICLFETVRQRGFTH